LTVAFTDFTMDAEAAAELCRSSLHREVESAEPCDRPTSFAVRLDDGLDVIVKVARPDRSASPAAEAWIYDTCRRHGVLVPEVLAVVDAPEAIITAKLNGRHIDHQDHDTSAVWRAAGADLRRVHEIAVPGFGPLRQRNGAVRGEADGWSPTVEYARREGLRGLVDLGLITTAEASRLARRYDEIEEELAAVTDGRLLHGDVWSGHLFEDATGNYIGMIDFDQAQSGDPRWDLARIPLWERDDALDLILDGYGADAITSDDREVLLPLYLIAFAIHHIVRVPFDDDPRRGRTMLEETNYRRLL
jgi:aminoglycoside phosphotransferase